MSIKVENPPTHPEKPRDRMNFKRLFLSFSMISLVLFSSLATAFYTTNTIKILRPCLAVPTIVMPNESILVQLRSKYPLPGIISLEMEIQSIYGDFALPLYHLTIEGNFIQINASIPAAVKTNILYDFSINVNGIAETQPNAVKVISNYKSNFTFIQWSDPQVEGFDLEDPEGTIPHMWQCTKQFDVLAPEFVLVTGDLTEWSSPKELKMVFDAIDSTEIPMFSILGNHEINPGEYYRQFGLLSYSFNYGPLYHFICLDTGFDMEGLSDATFQFFKSDLEAHQQIPYKYVAMHYPPFFRGPNRNFEMYRNEFVALCGQYNVKAVFYGHEHKDGVFDDTQTQLPWPITNYNGPLYLMTNDGRGEAAYRLITIKNHQIASYSQKISPTAYDPLKSNIAGKLLLEYDKDNDGSQTSLNVTVRNLEPYQSFDNICIPVHLKTKGMPTVHPSLTPVNYWLGQWIDAPEIYTLKIYVNMPANCTASFIVTGV